ncbi:MAG: flagellar protein FliT [Phycisphaerales bacterium JB059]
MTDDTDFNTTDDASWADGLERRLTLAEELFEQLGSLGRRQRELIEAGDAVGVLDLLRERQEVVDRISENSERIEPFRTRWDRVAPTLAPERRQLIQARLDSLTDAAGQIARKDEEDRRALERKRDELARELSGVSTGKAALSAYAEPKPNGPRFQDREG